MNKINCFEIQQVMRKQLVYPTIRYNPCPIWNLVRDQMLSQAWSSVWADCYDRSTYEDTK